MRGQLLHRVTCDLYKKHRLCHSQIVTCCNDGKGHRPTRTNMTNSHDDFSKMASDRQIFQRLFRFVKSEDPIDDRMDFLLAIKLQGLFKAIFRSIPDALEGDVSSQRQHIRVDPSVRFILFSTQVSNAGDRPALFDTNKALGQCLGPALFEDDIHAFILCDFHDFIVPFRCGSVVDDMISPELLRSLQLCVR